MAPLSLKYFNIFGSNLGEGTSYPECGYSCQHTSRENDSYRILLARLISG